MCIAFHPKSPSLIAGGSFNGTVFVWDLSDRDDPKTWRSPNEDFSHKEFISSVCFCSFSDFGCAEFFFSSFVEMEFPILGANGNYVYAQVQWTYDFREGYRVRSPACCCNGSHFRLTVRR
jgi:WD40 repeat protein